MVKHQVGIDRPTAVADQHRVVVDFSRFARFQNQTNTGAGAIANQVVVQPRDGQQGGNRRLGLVHIPVQTG